MSILTNLLRRKPKPIMGSPAANDSVRERLSEYGDDGAATRHVLHYAYPEGEKDLSTRPSIIEHFKSRGFEVSDAVANNGLVMEHYRPVTPEDFDKLTAELSAWFAERGWEYDGWECAVVASDEKLQSAISPFIDLQVASGK